MDAREAQLVVGRMVRGRARQRDSRARRQALALGLGLGGHLQVVVMLLVHQELLDRHADGDADEVRVVAAELGDALDQRPAEVAMGVDPVLEMLVRRAQRMARVRATEGCKAVEDTHAGS